MFVAVVIVAICTSLDAFLTGWFSRAHVWFQFVWRRASAINESGDRRAESNTHSEELVFASAHEVEEVAAVPFGSAVRCGRGSKCGDRASLLAFVQQSEHSVNRLDACGVTS